MTTCSVSNVSFSRQLIRNVLIRFAEICYLRCDSESASDIYLMTHLLHIILICIILRSGQAAGLSKLVWGISDACENDDGEKIQPASQGKYPPSHQEQVLFVIQSEPPCWNLDAQTHVVKVCLLQVCLGKRRRVLVWFIRPDEDTDIKKTMSTTKLVKMSKWL